MSREELHDKLNKWDLDLILCPEYTKNIYEIKSGMIAKQIATPLDMLSYQRIIIQEIKETEGISIPNFTDEELKENFFICKEYPSGIKITKYITKLLSEKTYLKDKRLDFFYKLRKEGNEYYIDSDPMAFVDMYRKVSTCVSPDGENAGNIFRFLFSPYTYIAYDKYQSVRMLIFADDESKLVFLNPVYGCYDDMFLISVIQNYIDRGYRFIANLNNIFSGDDFYKDSFSLCHRDLIKVMGGEILEEQNTVGALHLLDRPAWITFKGDGASGDVNQHIKLTTHIVFEKVYYCSECGQDVYYEDYDFDSDCCYNCSDDYCEHCDNYYSKDEYNFYYDACIYCAEDIKKGEEDEYKYQLEKDKKLEEEENV